jgi:hypothetical protein
MIEDDLMLIYKKKKKGNLIKIICIQKETHWYNKNMLAAARPRKKTQLVKITFK